MTKILKQVGRTLRNYESEDGYKQSCVYEIRHFYDKLYFNPGIYCADEEEDISVKMNSLDIQNLNGQRAWFSTYFIDFILWYQTLTTESIDLLSFNNNFT